jgi:hypothetical protein
MHVRELEGTINHMAMSLKEKGMLAIVTNIIEGAPTALTTFIEETSRIMKLTLQAKGKPIPVSNYVRTQEDYTKALQHAGLRIGSCTCNERIIAEPAPGVVNLPSSTMGGGCDGTRLALP